LFLLVVLLLLIMILLIVLLLHLSSLLHLNKFLHLLLGHLFIILIFFILLINLIIVILIFLRMQLLLLILHMLLPIVLRSARGLSIIISIALINWTICILDVYHLRVVSTLSYRSTSCFRSASFAFIILEAINFQIMHVLIQIVGKHLCLATSCWYLIMFLICIYISATIIRDKASSSSTIDSSIFLF
jgi:hypothetical protein